MRNLRIQKLRAGGTSVKSQDCAISVACTIKPRSSFKFIDMHTPLHVAVDKYIERRYSIRVKQHNFIVVQDTISPP